MVSRRTVAAALRSGNRDAVEQLARDLADEIDAAGTTRDRLPLVRAFLAAVAQLEAMTAATRRQERANATAAATDVSTPTDALDELLRKREAKRGRLRA